MLQCEGYKMFRGSMRIDAPRGEWNGRVISGVWLYKPEYDCWYCDGGSYPAEVMCLVEDETKDD